MARPKHNTCMTSAEIAQTFGDKTAMILEERQAEIIQFLRVLRSDIVELHDEDRAKIEECIEDFLEESRMNTNRLRNIRRDRSESIGMKIR